MKKFEIINILVVLITLISSCNEKETNSDEVSSISVKTEPVKTDYYEGDTLDLSGLVVTLTMESGNMEDVAFTEFGAKGITTSPADGDVLSTGLTEIVITHNTSGKSTNQVITVSVKIETGEVMDIDDNTYTTVIIGSQEWMAENLKTTKYSNGDVIGTTDPDTLDIRGELEPKYQWAYHGEESNVDTYGRLYTWFAATDSRNICPTGWHLPTDADWTILTNSLGGIPEAGDKMKETGTSHWLTTDDIHVTNESGFTALPGGLRADGGPFDGMTLNGWWWSATEFADTYAYFRWLSHDQGMVYANYDQVEKWAFSIRCVKD